MANPICCGSSIPPPTFDILRWSRVFVALKTMWYTTIWKSIIFTGIIVDLYISTLILVHISILYPYNRYSNCPCFFWFAYEAYHFVRKFDPEPLDENDATEITNLSSPLLISFRLALKVTIVSGDWTIDRGYWDCVNFGEWFQVWIIWLNLHYSIYFIKHNIWWMPDPAAECR